MGSHDPLSVDNWSARLRVAREKIRQITCSKNETIPNKTKDFDLRQEDSVVYQRPLPAAKSASKSECRKLCF